MRNIKRSSSVFLIGFMSAVFFLVSPQAEAGRWWLSSVGSAVAAALDDALASGKLFVGSVGGVATARTMTGDVSVSNTGVATVDTVGAKTAAAIAQSVVDTIAAASANTVSVIVKRDGSGNFAAGTITANLTGNVTGTVSGNAGTATALAADPADCSAGSFASAINASGTLTCSNPFTGQVESYTGHIETAANKTYVIDHYASYAKQITNIRVKCTSGSITAALKIGGTNITTCNGISVTTSSATTTCDTGSTNDLAANAELTLVTTSNSTCTDLVWTIKTTRD